MINLSILIFKSKCYLFIIFIINNFVTFSCDLVLLSQKINICKFTFKSVAFSDLTRGW